MKNKNDISGVICALVPNIIFGFSFLFSKTALNFAHPLIILAVRFTVAFAAMFILRVIGVIKVNFKGKNVKMILLMSLMQPLLYFLLELYGLKGTSSALSGVITSLVPIGVIVLSDVFLKEKPTKLQIVCSVISVAAVAAVSLLAANGGGKTEITACIMLICAVVAASVFNILSRGEAKNFSPVERTYMMFAVGAAGFDIIAPCVLREKFIPELLLACSHIEFWGAILYLSVASSVFAFLMYNYATSKIDAVRAASFSNIITVVSVFAGVVILKEPLSILQIILCVIIILSVWGVNRVKK